MTDRYNALTVVLEHDVRCDDAEPLIAAIRMLRGVIKVEPHVADMEATIAEARARRQEKAAARIKELESKQNRAEIQSRIRGQRKQIKQLNKEIERRRRQTWRAEARIDEVMAANRELEAELAKLRETYGAGDQRHRCDYSEAFNVLGYFATADAAQSALVSLVNHHEEHHEREDRRQAQGEQPASPLSREELGQVVINVMDTALDERGWERADDVTRHECIAIGEAVQAAVLENLPQPEPAEADDSLRRLAEAAIAWAIPRGSSPWADARHLHLDGTLYSAVKKLSPAMREAIAGDRAIVLKQLNALEQVYEVADFSVTRLVEVCLEHYASGERKASSLAVATQNLSKGVRQAVADGRAIVLAGRDDVATLKDDETVRSSDEWMNAWTSAIILDRDALVAWLGHAEAVHRPGCACLENTGKHGWCEFGRTMPAELRALLEEKMTK